MSANRVFDPEQFEDLADDYSLNSGILVLFFILLVCEYVCFTVCMGMYLHLMITCYIVNVKLILE